MGNEMLHKQSFHKTLWFTVWFHMLMKAVKWPTKGFMNHIILAVARAVTIDQNLLSKHYYLAHWILSI